MKLLAALTLLLPAVHVAALSGNFGLRIGPNHGDAVVIKSPENPLLYVVDTSVGGGPEERFEWIDNDTLIDQDKKFVQVGGEDNLSARLHKWDVLGFYIDEKNKLKTNDKNKEFYICPPNGRGKKLLKLSSFAWPDCEKVDVYQFFWVVRSVLCVGGNSSSIAQHEFFLFSIPKRGFLGEVRVFWMRHQIL